MKRNDLALPYAKHKNKKGVKKLTRPDNINILCETDIHYVNAVGDGMHYSMNIKDCFSRKWISSEFSKTCTAKDCTKSVENAYMIRFADGNHHDLILRTDNGPKYVSETFKNTVKILGIRPEYIQKQTPEDNGEIESFHNSLKTNYIWPNDLETFEDAKNLLEYAFYNYNTVRPDSFIEYLPLDEFERRLCQKDDFMDKFLEERKRKEEKRMKNRIERKRRLMENVSLEDGISVQN